MIDRRCFLKTVAAAWALPPMARSREVPGPGLGFSLYGMKTLPLEEALKTCAEIGYSHVELALNAGYPTEPKVLLGEARKATSGLLKSLRLGLSALMVNVSLAADDKTHADALRHLSEAGDMAHDLMSDSPPVIETVLGGKPATWEQQKEKMAERLHDWASTAAKARILLAIKAHVASAVNSPERLLWLLDKVQSASIVAAYDYSHFELQGIDMEESMAALLPRTRFIHVKDSEGVPEKFQFLLPGQGRTDYGKYFKLLRKFDYRGPVCVEVSGQIFNRAGYDPVKAARSAYAALSTALRG
jgi:inosose dehydratase